MSNEIINAVKRLERAGAGASAANGKLREAAEATAAFIVRQVPPAHRNLDFGGYEVIQTSHYYAGTEYRDVYLVVINGRPGTRALNYNDGHEGAPVDPPSLLDLHEFAQAIAGGLLDKIAARLEVEASRDAAAADSLTTAKEQRDPED